MKSNPNEWQKFFKQTRFTLFSTAIIQQQLIQLIINKIPLPGARLLEAGFGSGTTLVLLYDLGYHIEGIDNDECVISEFKRRFPYLSKLVRKGNIYDPDSYIGHYDAIISQGTMEHFTDQEIIKILQLQIQYADKIIFDVPSNRRMVFDKEGIGSTRFEPPEFWENIVEKAGLKFQRYGRNLDIDNDLLPDKLKKYDSYIMKNLGRSTIMVCFK